MEKPQSGQPKFVGLFSVKHDLFSRLDHPVVNLTGLLTPADLGFHVRWEVSTIGQRWCPPSCQTTGIIKSANFESKLAVRALMWSTKSGTPRSS